MWDVYAKIRNLKIGRGIFVILTSASLVTGGVVGKGRDQTAFDDRPAKCRALNSQNVKLTNEMLDIERKSKIEISTGQLKAQNGVLARMEEEQKQVKAGRLTASLQQDREATAAELDLKWDDRWNLDYVAYYEAIIGAQKKVIKAIEAEILDLKDSMVNELLISGVDLDLRHQAIKKELKGINTEMETLKCGEVLESDRLKDEVDIKNAEREKFMVDLAAFETQVNAAVARSNRLKVFVTDAIRLSNDARKAAAQAGEILISFKKMRVGEFSQLAINAATNKCAFAKKELYEIEQELIEVRRKESLIQSSLQSAAAQANTCTSKEQADIIEERYRTAVKLVAEIGGIERAATQRKVALETARQGVVDGNAIVPAAQAEARRIDAEKNRVKSYRAEVNKSINASAFLVEEIRTEARRLLGEYGRVRQEYNRLFPPNVGDQTRARVAILESRIQALLATSVPDELAKYYAEIGAREVEIEGIREQAESTVKQYEGAFCDLKVFDDAIAKANTELVEIAGTLREMSFEVGLASNLPRKAKDCVNRAACQTLTSELRAAVNANDIGRADGLIARANGMGCDTSALKAELDAKSESEAVSLINASKQNCRFQQAVDLATQIPASIRSMPRVSQAIAEAQAGVQAQQQIEQLIDNADKTSDIAAANSFISQARSVASPYPCLADMLKGTGNRTPAPAVEQLPEDRTSTGTDSKTPPKVEELPEDKNGGTPTTSKTGGREVPPTVEEIPDADNKTEDIPSPRTTANTPASKEQAPKPKKTGPGFWETLGKVSAGVAQGIINSGIGQKPQGGSTGDTTLPPPAGSLVGQPVSVKPGRSDERSDGKYVYSFSATTGTREDIFPPSEGGTLRLSWSFSGVPTGSLQPGQEYRISVNGSFTTSLAPRDLSPPASGGVTLTGDVDIIKGDHAYISKSMGRNGEYVFKVRPNAKSVTIQLWGDYGISTFATYKFGEVK